LRGDPHHSGLYLTSSHRWVYRRLVPTALRAAAKRMFGISTEFIIQLGTAQREDALKRYGAYQAAAEQRYRRIEELRQYDPRLHPEPDAKVPGFSHSGSQEWARAPREFGDADKVAIGIGRALVLARQARRLGLVNREVPNLRGQGTKPGLAVQP
jgi:hypothetical protein